MICLQLKKSDGKRGDVTYTDHFIRVIAFEAIDKFLEKYLD